MSKRKRRENNRVEQQNDLKLSKIIGEFAHDFISMGTSLEQKQSLLNAAVSAWNISLTSGDKRTGLVDEYMELYKSYNPHFAESDYRDVRENIEKLITEKERLYPNVSQVILSAEIINVNGKNYITAAFSDFK